MNMGKKSIDLTGKVFGRLIVLELVPNCQFRTWKVQCSCGGPYSIKNVRSMSLVKKNGTKSCGCIHKENISILMKGRPAPTRGKDSQKASLNALYRSYRADAKKRNLIFDLSVEEFDALRSDKCFYCGAYPSNTFNAYLTKNNILKNKKGNIIQDWALSATIVYNGLDRSDNSSGYSVINCTSCCQLCNFIKRTLNKNEFLLFLKLPNSTILKLIKFNNKIITNMLKEDFDCHLGQIRRKLCIIQFL